MSTLKDYFKTRLQQEEDALRVRRDGIRSKAKWNDIHNLIGIAIAWGCEIGWQCCRESKIDEHARIEGRYEQER